MKFSALIASSLFFGESIAFQFSLHQQPLKDVDNCECNCTGAIPTVGKARFYVCENADLGPVYLPFRMSLLSFVSNYDRFGDLAPGAFLERWINKTDGKYLYPDGGCFQVNINGTAIKAPMILEIGTKVDRFGNETGRYVSAADAPFAQRSLPPSSLNVVIDPENPRERFDHLFCPRAESPIPGITSLPARPLKESSALYDAVAHYTMPSLTSNRIRC